MDQSRALNALEPFVALAKSANSPRAAADLVTQATSAANTYVFAELLQQPNIQALAKDEQYKKFHTLLQVFSWGTWEDYQAATDLPELSSAQQHKLRLLSLLTIASTRQINGQKSPLDYNTLIKRLNLGATLELEQLVIAAIYADLIAATLNPAAQKVVITSTAPLRDLAPGSVTAMIAELAAWNERCDTVLAELEKEIANVRDGARRRNLREAKAERQIRAVHDNSERQTPAQSLMSKIGQTSRGGKREGAERHEDPDIMDLDARDQSSLGGTGKKRNGAAGLSGIFGRMGGKTGR